MKKNLSSSKKDKVLEQVGRDLNDALSHFKNQRFGIKNLSSKMQIHSKTLDRLLIGKHKPSYQTLFKIYSYLLKENDFNTLLKKTPDVIKKEIIQYSPNKPEELIVDPLAEKELQNNALALEIYILCGSGSVLSKDIKKHYGLHGLKTLEKLKKLNVLKENPKNVFSLTDHQIHLGPFLLKQISQLFINSYFRENSAEISTENYIGILTEGINEKTYLKILELDRKLFQEKVALISDKNNRGEIRLFTSQVTDKVILNSK